MLHVSVRAMELILAPVLPCNNCLRMATVHMYVTGAIIPTTSMISARTYPPVAVMTSSISSPAFFVFVRVLVDCHFCVDAWPGAASSPGT